MEIKLENISYIIKEETIIDKLNLEIPRNTITGLIGETGSGKTTLLELMSALKTPSEGQITIGDYKIDNQTIKEVRPYLGIVYQNPTKQFFYDTIKKELEFSLQSYHLNPEEKEKRIHDSLALVGLNQTYLEKSPFEISKGEQRKLAIALVLAFNPKIIILDEPTKDLDSQSKKHLIKLLKLMKLRYHKTIIIATSDTDTLLSLANQIYLLKKGHIIKQGDKYDILSDCKLLEENNIQIPKIIEFSKIVKEKTNVNIGYRDDIKDLMKDIYRYVE